MSEPIVIILAAGIGSRLGRPHPKPLTPLNDGETILSRQVRIFRQMNLQVVVVVGFKKELIMEAAPDLLFAYNPNFDTTNTSKSLLAGLRNIRNHDVLWANGDVVFDPSIVETLLNSPDSSVAVNNARVGEEEVKYTLNGSGYINAISKKVTAPLGEALGINLIRKEYLEEFRTELAAAGDNDYFERAMETLIDRCGNVFRPVNVGQRGCIEVDFPEDLEAARAMLNEKGLESE